MDLKNLEFEIIPNNLECIVLFILDDELDNGNYNHFLRQINNTINTINVNNYFSKKIDFKIITNKNSEIINIATLRPLFRSVEVISSSIDGCNSKHKYNCAFFECFKYLTQYNTTLFLKCECQFSEDWLERIYNFVRFSGGFWISGGFYDGEDPEVEWGIVDGRVALYATGNYLFLNFLKHCYELFSTCVEKNDISLDQLIKKTIDDQELKIKKFMNRQYNVNNFIFNYNFEKDNDYLVFNIKNKYNYSILHKNLNCEKTVFSIEELANFVDDNFDEKFYITQYPQISDYYEPHCKQLKISDRVRFYHHYINFGKDLGFFKNENEKNIKCTRNFSLEEIGGY